MSNSIKNTGFENIEYHNFEKHLFSIEEEVGFHLCDNNSTTHIHKGFAEFSIIVSGEWDHTIDGHTSRLGKNTLFFLGNNTMHSLKPCSPGCNHFTFFFKEEYLKNFLIKYFPNNMSILSTKYKEQVLPPSVSTFLLYEANQMIGSRSSHNHKIEFQNYMHNLIYFTFFGNNIHSELSNENIYGCNLKISFDNYRLLDESLKAVYSMFPVSPTTLIKQFEAVTGQTIVQYRNDKRMEYATVLLKGRKLTIIDVANRVGISSPSHFSAEFKKKFGVSPKDFAKRHRL